jgi:hypothetical protein
MTAVKNSHIEDDLVLVLKKQTPTVKVITVKTKNRADQVFVGGPPP